LRWSTELIQNPASKTLPQARAKALITQAYMLWHMQQFEAVHSIAEECLPVFRSCGDQPGEYDTLILMGNVSQFAAGMEQRAEFHRQALALARSMGDVLRQAYALSLLGRDPRDPQRSREQLQEAVLIFRQIGDWRFLAQTLGVLGNTVLSSGDLASAQTFLEEAYQINQQSNKSAMDFVLTGKAILSMLHGEYGQARTFLQTNIDDLEQKGNRMRVLWSYAWLGFVALREGSMAEAQQILFEIIQNFHADQNRSGLAFALDRMASLYVVINNPELAARLIGWSDATRAEIGDPRPSIEQADLEPDIAAIKGKIGAAAYETAYTAGQALTLNDAVALASGGK